MTVRGAAVGSAARIADRRRGVRRVLRTMTVALSCAFAFAALAPGAGWAASVTPIHLPGASNDGKSCADLGFTELELKQDGVNSNPGTYVVSGGGFSVTFTVPSILDNTVPPPGEKKNSLDFQAAPGTVVFGVIVKNGVDGANFYDYRPAGTTADLFLTTPFNGDQGISHISACVGPPKAKVTIVKDAVPNHPQNFSFTGAGTLTGSFQLDDDADGTLSNTQTILPGQFGSGTVGETPVDGWDLESIACVNAQGAPVATIKYGTGSGAAFTPGADGDAFGVGDTTVQIDVQAGVDVTCTFTNKQVALDVVKTAADTTVDAGDQISFSMTTSNAGPGTARGVTLSDNLPAGVNWTISAQPVGNPCSIAPPAATSGQVLSCSFGDLAAGQQRVVTVVATTSETACAVYDNTVTVDATNAPPDTSSASIVCLPAALTVVKTPDNGIVDAGDAVTFTIVTTSQGPGTAKGVTLNDPLPAGLDWSILSQTNLGECAIAGAVGSEVLSCSYGDLADNATRTVVVTATTSQDACAVYDNTATVDATNAPPDDDAGRVTCNKPDLGTEKAALDVTVDAGDDISFTITTTNTGAGTAKDVVLSDPLPAGVDWSISSQTNPGECSISGAVGSEVLTCDYGDLGPEATRSVTVTATTSETACATYDNTATVSASNAPDDTGQASIVCNAPSLTVVKTPDDQLVQAGQSVTFAIVTVNSGPGAAKDVTLDDPLPDGLTWSIASQTTAGECVIQGTGNDQRLVCDYGTLADDASRSVTVTAATSATACAVYDNTATVDATNAPPDSDAGRVRCEVPPPPPPAPAPAAAPVTGQAAPVVRGTAALRGPSGCPDRPTLRMWVVGRQIQSVRFTLDRATTSGKSRAARLLGTVRRADRLGRWLITIPTRGLRPGTYRVRAVVTFRPESQTRTRTLQRRFRICGQIKPARTPFTG